MNLPGHLKYSTDHEWAKADGATLTVGITDFAQGELGDIIFIEFPEVGDSFEKGDSFGTVEAVKTVADLYSPVSGEIVEINSRLEDEPGLLNTDPYGDGWIVKINMDDPSEMDDLLTDDEYKAHIG